MKPQISLFLSLLTGLCLARGETVAASVSSVPSTETVALRPGEAFKFRVGWGLFSGAGEVVVTATSSSLASGTPLTRVTTQTATKGTIGALYSFTGQAIADFDGSDGRLLKAHAETHAGRKPTEMSITFDYARGAAAYVDPLRPARTRTLTLPPGRPMDLITVLIQARAWNLQPGEKHPALVLFDDEFYPLTITAQKLEQVSTPKGKRDAMLLVPEMDGTPKGMFRKGGVVNVWISNDAERLPLKFEVKVKVGTAVATLVDYQPPIKEPEKKTPASTPTKP